MANIQVTLIWRCKTEKGWRSFRAIFGSNGRPRKGWVREGDPPKEVNYPDGRFQLRYYEGDKVVYKNIGPDANKALDGKRVLENLLKARTSAAAAGVQIVAEPQRKTLAKEYAAFLQAADDRGALESKQVYRTALDDFFQVVRKTYVDELDGEDLLRYRRYLRESGKADRTIHNRWANVKAFYLYCDLNLKVMKVTAPRYEEQIPETYESGEMKRFFRAIEHDHSFYTACQIMLKCGLRDQEIRYLEWPQVNLTNRNLHIRANLHYGFKVKDKEQRSIPIPADLADWLTTYRAEYPDIRLVAPTRNGKPNTKFLLRVKEAAHRAGLNCNSCAGCRRNKQCERWFLHKFRATAITQWLRPKAMGGAALDLSTVMTLSGHSDYASVKRYLNPADNESVRKSVDEMRWGD